MQQNLVTNPNRNVRPPCRPSRSARPSAASAAAAAAATTATRDGVSNDVILRACVRLMETHYAPSSRNNITRGAVRFECNSGEQIAALGSAAARRRAMKIIRITDGFLRATSATLLRQKLLLLLGNNSARIHHLRCPC